MSPVKQLITLIVIVQFVTAMDFVLVMPLGPDLATGLAFSVEQLAWLSSAYALAAASAALISFQFLDRFGRKLVLLLALAGLLIATVSATFAWSLESMIAARVMAGAFGGPAVSICFSIIADRVPQEARGKAIGLVMLGYPLAAILGIPLALLLADQFSWQWAFYLLALLVFFVWLVIYTKLPPLKEHLGRSQKIGFQFSSLYQRREITFGVLASASMLFPDFLLIPHISSIIQFNYGFPREQLSVLYLVAGVINLLFVQLAGRMTDRFGSLSVAITLVGIFSINLFCWLILKLDVNVTFFYLLFFSSFSAYMVPVGAISSKVPQPHERAGYGAIQSLIQHLGCGLAAMVSYSILDTNDSGALLNLGTLATISVATVFLIPLVILSIERHLKNPRLPLSV